MILSLVATRFSVTDELSDVEVETVNSFVVQNVSFGFSHVIVRDPSLTVGDSPRAATKQSVCVPYDMEMVGLPQFASDGV